VLLNIPSSLLQHSSQSLSTSNILIMPALTKKQQKLQAFRSGKGKKDRAEPEDVPEQDVLPDEDEPTTTAEGAESAEYKAKSKSKKSKEKKLKEKLAKEGVQGAVDGEPKAKSEKAKGKEKEVVKDGEAKVDGAAEGEEKVAKKTKKDIKQRFILFVGKYDSHFSGNQA
jgi:nucleolar protein 6